MPISSERYTNELLIALIPRKDRDPVRIVTDKLYLICYTCNHGLVYIINADCSGVYISCTDAPTPINLYTFISLKSGSAKGRYTIKLVPEAPSGIKLPEQLLPVLFEGDDRGANLILALNMLIDQEGIYISFIFTFTHFTSDAPFSSVYYDSKGQKLYPMV